MGGSKNSGDPASAERVFTLRLLIKHPTISFEQIQNELQREPVHGHDVGRARRTPTGRVLSGTWNETLWSHSEVVIGRRDFFRCGMKFAMSFEGNREFLRLLRDTGGLVTICVDLTECANFGDVLREEDMRVLGRLGMDIGVEYFPPHRISPELAESAAESGTHQE